MPPSTIMFPLTFHQYQCCHRQHLICVTGTRAVEKLGAAFGGGATLRIADLRTFTEQVCKWGGRTGGRILWRIQHTLDSTVLSGFTNAIKEIGACNVLGAKNELKPIGGLGKFSYSSKHIRMLAPHLSGVLDGIVETYLARHVARVSRSHLYVAYCNFCVEKARDLTAASVKKGDFITCVPGRSEPELGSGGSDCHWLAADVDMACFAWLQGWCHSGTSGKISTSVKGGVNDESSVELPPTHVEGKQRSGHISEKPMVYLCQDHKLDQAVTLKEDCESNWNLGWICRTHGRLDFKLRGAWGTTRCLIDEIAALGGNVLKHPNYHPSTGGATCHQGGKGYQGGISFGSVTDSVRYLRRYFIVKACPCNYTETQVWINKL